MAIPMLLRSIVAGIVLSATAVSSNADDENTRLSTAFTEALTKLAANNDPQLGLAVHADGFTVGQHALRVIPVSEQVGELRGKFFSAARFEVTLDGKKVESLTTGSIGLGESAQDARETAIKEWYAVFGVALFNALAGKPTVLTHNGSAIYSGYMGLRGEAAKDWLDGSDNMHRKILTALATVIPKADAKLHTLDLKISVQPDGSVDGECRIDGTPSNQILALLKNLPWPPPGTGYLLKQAYVLTSP